MYRGVQNASSGIYLPCRDDHVEEVLYSVGVGALSVPHSTVHTQLCETLQITTKGDVQLFHITASMIHLAQYY